MTHRSVSGPRGRKGAPGGVAVSQDCPTTGLCPAPVLQRFVRRQPAGTLPPQSLSERLLPEFCIRSPPNRGCRCAARYCPPTTGPAEWSPLAPLPPSQLGATLKPFHPADLRIRHVFHPGGLSPVTGLSPQQVCPPQQARESRATGSGFAVVFAESGFSGDCRGGRPGRCNGLCRPCGCSLAGLV